MAILSARAARSTSRSLQHPWAPPWLAAALALLLPQLGLPAALAESPPTGPRVWQLSIVNGGLPAASQRKSSPDARVALAPVDWSPSSLCGARFSLQLGDVLPVQAHTVWFGRPGAIPFSGDFNGDGFSEIGVYHAGQWFIDLNGNGQWDDGDLWASLGTEHDLPVTGDWDGDGKTDIGVLGPQAAIPPDVFDHQPGLPHPLNRLLHRRKNAPHRPGLLNVWRTLQHTAQRARRADPIDHAFAADVASAIPVVGDWTGSGVPSIGLFCDGRWLLDTDGDGRFGPADRIVQFGQPGDRPAVGDFNGDGIDDLALYRQGKWLIDFDGDGRFGHGDLAVDFGGPDDLPVVGDWDGDGRAQLGLYHPHTAAPGAPPPRLP